MILPATTRQQTGVTSVANKPGTVNMSLLKGAMGATRYRVLNPPTDLNRDDLLETSARLGPPVLIDSISTAIA